MTMSGVSGLGGHDKINYKSLARMVLKRRNIINVAGNQGAAANATNSEDIADDTHEGSIMRIKPWESYRAKETQN